jgi:phage baseplate assembly protein W
MITISNLSNKKSGNAYSYSDIHLDLIPQQHSRNKQNNKIVTGNDIVIDTDKQAIQNSVVNLLTQTRYLTPLVNLNLKGFIGQPITTGTSKALGDKVKNGLVLLEPRIKVQKIFVGPNVDGNAYQIAIVYTLNNFPKEVTVINGILNNNNGVFTLNNLNN